VFPRKKRRHKMSRKKHSKELKARIALDAIKGQKTMSELASEYGVYSNQIGRWKKQLLEAAPDIFTRPAGRSLVYKFLFLDHS
jgi:transposase-like protein